jgi:coenzyme F420 hydrogenase subunit beta
VSRLGFVGTPCQIQGLRKLQALADNLELGWAKNVGLAIGLFCMGNWSYPCIKGYLEKHGIELEKVNRATISGYEVEISLSNGRVVLPLTGLRKYVRLACKLCLDFTSELADVSVGSIGSPRGWSTVIVRSAHGEELVSKAEAAGVIEVREVNEAQLKKLEETARKKIERNTRRILGRIRQGMKIPHYSTKELQSLPIVSGKDFKELWDEIVVTGLCDACGACSAACEHIEMRNGLPRLRKRCPTGCDRCYIACTRTALPVEVLERSFNLGGTHAPYIGRYRRILAARATSEELHARAQDGGAVTALIKFSLTAGIIDEALLTCRNEEWEPFAVFVGGASEVSRCAGSVYAASSPLPLLRTQSSY